MTAQPTLHGHWSLTCREPDCGWSVLAVSEYECLSDWAEHHRSEHEATP